MSNAAPLELGPLSLYVVDARPGRTELRVTAFDQPLGTVTTALAPDLDALLGSETELTALFNLFKDHCAPLLRQRAQRGPASVEALCLRLSHPCDNPQCDAVHELLCMNSAARLLADAAPASTGTPFTLVDADGHPLAPPQVLTEADTERLLLQHVAPALVEMVHFFTPACLETELSRWEPPTPADQDIISYFGFFSGAPDALYGVYQYVNPLLLSIWLDRIDACHQDTSATARARAQEAWFKLLARLHILPEGFLSASRAAAAMQVLSLPVAGGSRRLH